MGWFIQVTGNTVTIPGDKIDLVNEACVEMDYDARFDEGNGPVGDDGRLEFNSDDMEHMDWLTENEELCTVVAASGASGDVTFGSLEGDNRGTFWGVRFNGDFTYTMLKGSVSYEPK